MHQNDIMNTLIYMQPWALLQWKCTNIKFRRISFYRLFHFICFPNFAEHSHTGTEVSFHFSFEMHLMNE